jgi:tricorn protease interacting factor F2/3
MPIAERPMFPEYRLSLDVDFAGLRWNGSVEIDTAPGPAPLELDAEDLEIGAVSCDGSTSPFELDRSRAKLRIPLGEHATRVRVDFSGRVDPKRLVGFYRSPSGDGYVLTTQCEPVGARRVFPCVDRPNAKAAIRLTVRAPPDLEVISNCPPAQVVDQPGARVWAFGPTPPMATYLFYVALGVFDRFDDTSWRVPVRVFTPPGRGPSGRYGAEVGARILRAYETYYGLPYPLPKLDLIAVGEHAFGAMENWGAISFRDVRLLIDPTSSSYARSDVFETVCHEIGHQWFGNLVTMEWWTDIWLNESFATFLEAKISDQIAPEVDAFTDFLLRPWGMRAALDRDAFRETHPVRQPVSTPDEIGETTDEITYGKGSSVLRMIDAYLGEDVFRAGVTDYLTRFQFRNARTEDLWEALGRSAGSDIVPILGPWIDRPGVPLVEARLGSGGLHLRQRRFAYDPIPEEAPWPIPLVLDVDGRTERLLFDGRERTVPIPPSATVHLNPSAVGYYRVLYDHELLGRLRRTLPSRSLMDRWIVLNDLAAFVLSGDADWGTYHELAREIGLSTERLIVEEVIDTMSVPALAMPRRTDVAGLTRSFFADLTSLVSLERKEGEPDRAGIVRERVALARVRVDEGFARDLSDRFPEWDRLDPDLRRSVAIARARTEGEAGFREIRRSLARSLPEGEALRLVIALAWSGEPSLVASTLDLASAGEINRGHIPAVVANAAANPAGRARVEPWLERNLSGLAAIYKGSNLLSLLLENTLPYAGLEHTDETRSYFRSNPVPQASRGVAKGLERLELVERLCRRISS